jgi:phenylpropionate dioxygenase-like ring-hydroxylating dioxygenase large terminal subunit
MSTFRNPGIVMSTTIPNPTLVQQSATQIDESLAEKRSQVTGVGTWFLKNIWYFAYPGSKLKPGQMESKTILGEPILIGRDSTGKPFAMKDICPHQAVPLSMGRFDGSQVECPFHGWKFGTDGVCSEIPSLCSDQEFNVCRIKAQSYPCREVQGNIWVFMGDQTADLPEVPTAPGLDGLNYHQSTVTLIIPTHIDYACAALIDPAHVPYVHNAWWWRSTRNMKDKTKKYVPSGNGWTMVKHQPPGHSIAFKLIGKHIETEISFRLPGCRREYLTWQGGTFLSGISMLTPIDETHTELNHSTYWTIPGTGFMTPIVNYFVRTFLGQDQTIAQMQEVGLRTKPNLIMTIKDAGTPGHWYFLLKKEWALACAEGRAFVNPIKESILRWRS